MPLIWSHTPAIKGSNWLNDKRQYVHQWSPWNDTHDLEVTDIQWKLIRTHQLHPYAEGLHERKQEILQMPSVCDSPVSTYINIYANVKLVIAAGVSIYIIFTWPTRRN